MTILEAGIVGPNGEPSAGSMAAAIYRALKDLVPLGANEDPHGRSALAVAVDTGVIQHLKERQAAFTLNNGRLTIN